MLEITTKFWHWRRPQNGCNGGSFTALMDGWMGARWWSASHAPHLGMKTARRKGLNHLCFHIFCVGTGMKLGMVGWEYEIGYTVYRKRNNSIRNMLISVGNR